MKAILSQRLLPLPKAPATAALFLLALAPAAALADGAQDGEFPVERFEPAPGSGNLLSVEGARMGSAVGFSGGVFFDYGRDPFVLRSCISETDCSAPAPGREDVHVVRNLFTWNLLAAVTPINILQIGLRVPLAYVNGDGIDSTTGGPASGGLHAFGLGDPMLEGKLRFAGGPDQLYAIGGALDVSAPLGHATAENAYIGDSSPITVGLRGIVDLNAGPVSVDLNLRGLFRADATLGTTTIGPEFRYGAGVAYAFSAPFRILAEGYGATRFSSKNGTNSLEIDGAFQVFPGSSGLALTLGGGAGVIQGEGVPIARIIAGITYTHEPGTAAKNEGEKDSDGDGIPDRLDKCPDRPEDKDGFQDQDGCPDGLTNKEKGLTD